MCAASDRGTSADAHANACNATNGSWSGRSTSSFGLAGGRKLRPSVHNIVIDVEYEETNVDTSELRYHDGSSPVAFSPAVFGSSSIFDINVPRKKYVPYKVPAREYIEEVLIGVHGADASPTARRSSRGSTPSRSESTKSRAARERWRRLKRALDKDAALDVVEALFWLAVGLIFNRVHPTAMDEFRTQLAEAWHLLVLAVQSQIPDNRVHRDQLLSGLPVAIVQTVYRLLVDAFVAEDRALLVQGAAAMVEKLTSIMNFEVVGFQPSEKTNDDARRRMFRKFVLDSPYINQHENVKNQERIQMLEGDPKQRGHLKFGHLDAMPMDELQLEHVLVGREKERKLERRASNRPRTPVGQGDEDGESRGLPLAARQLAAHSARLMEELSVDRYADFGPQGLELFRKHLSNMDPAMAEAFSESTASPQACEEDLDHVSDGGSDPSCPGTSNVRKTLARSSGAGSRKNQNQSRKEADLQAKVAEQKRRYELLQKQVEKDSLPRAILKPGFDTVLVSPATDRLAPADRPRQVLNKRAAESFNLKMSPAASVMALPPLLARSSTADGCLKDTSSSHGGSVAASEMVGGSSPSLRTVRSADGTSPLSGKPSVLLDMRPPKRLTHALVLKRLESQLQAFHAMSFHAYTEEYDMYTGQKKQRMDQEELNRNESKYVKELQSLVGGPRSQPVRHSKYGVGGAGVMRSGSNRSEDLRGASKSAPSLPPL